MKTFHKLLFIPLMGLTLSACSSLFPFIKPSYAGYEEYMEKELKFSKYTKIDDLNAEIAEKAYQWKIGEHNEQYKSTDYITAHNLSVTIYDEGDRYSVYTTDGSSFYYSPDKTYGYLASFRSKAYNNLYLFPSGNISNYLNKDENNITEEQKEIFDIHFYDDGALLIFMDGKHLVYMENDKKTFYVSDDYTATFQGVNNTKTVPTCSLLISALEKLEFSTLTLPAPEGDFEAWAGENYYKEKYSNFGIYLAGVDIFDYIEVLKDNGFTVIRASDDIIFLPFYKERSGSWFIHDDKGELKGAMSFQDYLYINNVGKEYGPKFNVQIDLYKSTYGLFDGRNVTTRTDWSDSEKETMQGWYDGSLNVIVPFHPLAVGYYVPSSMSRASEDLFGGALMLGHECYIIQDSSIDYHLDGYDETLEAAGYHKYVPAYELSDPEQLSAYKKSDESKYYECYINEELDCAIKFSFSFSKGNCIKVFKKSLMKSYLDDPK